MVHTNDANIYLCALTSRSKIYFIKLLPVIFERNEADFGVIVGRLWRKI